MGNGTDSSAEPGGMRHYSFFSSLTYEGLQARKGDLVTLTVTDLGFGLAVRYMADDRRYSDRWGNGIEERLSFDSSRETGGILPGLGNGEMWKQTEGPMGYFHNPYSRPTHIQSYLETVKDMDPRMTSHLNAYHEACHRRMRSMILHQRAMLMSPTSHKRRFSILNGF